MNLQGHDYLAISVHRSLDLLFRKFIDPMDPRHVSVPERGGKNRQPAAFLEASD